MDLFWISYFRFCSDVLSVKYAEQAIDGLNIMHEIGLSCSWWYPRDGILVACERPKAIHWNADARPRLHNPAGPAVKFRDGWEIYSWNGMRLRPNQEWIIKTPNLITPAKIQEERNVEVRRIMLEIFTPSRFVQQVAATILDEVGDYILYQAPVSDDEPLTMLRCVCPSTGREYYERVPPNMTSAWQALSWQFGQDEDDYKPIYQS